MDHKKELEKLQKFMRERYPGIEKLDQIVEESWVVSRRIALIQVQKGALKTLEKLPFMKHFMKSD